MKTNSSIIAIVFILILSINCNSDNKSDNLHNSSVVKIIKTKAYSTKQAFDKLVCNEPVYNLGYDKLIGLDCSWNIKSYDKFNNILKIEFFDIDENGKEVFSNSINYEYYTPEKGDLALVVYGTGDTTSYIRDDKGQLMSIIASNAKGVMYKKTSFTYNTTGQLISKKIFEESGLKESYTYTYDIPFKDKGHIIKEVNQCIGYHFVAENKWDIDGRLLKSRVKRFDGSILKSDLTTNYFGYIGAIATREVVEGFDISFYEESADGTKRDIGGQRFKRTISRTINTKGDITKYLDHSDDIDKNGKVIPKHNSPIVSNGVNIYDCRYTYNKENDWTELLLTVGNQYLIIREIQYL